MSRTTAYSIAGYGDMLAEGPRVAAYTAALRAAVRPGVTVVDLGAGTGYFALLGAQLGAARVHAIEPDVALEVVRASAVANGFVDRVLCHPYVSTELVLNPPADVIVSDLRGVLPLFQHHIVSIADARRRLLRPGGTLIPARDHLFAALVHDRKLHTRHAEPWTKNDFGLDLTAGHPYVVNSWRKTEAKADQLVVPAQRWATLDYATIEDPNVAGSVVWTVERTATAHGLLLWFDAELMDGIGFSNAPGEPPLVYGQGYLPLEEAVELVPGDRVDVRIRADLVEGDYVWSWATTVMTADGATKAAFRQSTFKGKPVRPETLARKSAGHVPGPTTALAVDRFCLERIDGETSQEAIARALAEQFPERFKDWRVALNHVVRLTERYAGPS